MFRILVDADASKGVGMGIDAFFASSLPWVVILASCYAVYGFQKFASALYVSLKSLNSILVVWVEHLNSPTSLKSHLVRQIPTNPVELLNP